MNHLFGWANAQAFAAGGEKARWSDLLGNLLGLATVALALRRSLWTWPVQIAGAILLLGADLAVHLGGTAARQLAVIALAGYGWRRWSARQDSGPGAAHVRVRWAVGRERAALLLFLAAGTFAFAWLLSATHGSWNPLPDAYIFVGTLAATLAQSRGWVEFWFVWIAVDAVGVPLAFTSGLPVSGFTYVIYFALVLAGLRQWTRLAAADRARAANTAATTVPARPEGVPA
ncbi:MAG: nicotinamide mononucleotide transporter family protein [Actinocrinis sp.]